MQHLSRIVGRERELQQLRCCFKTGHHVLIEGPVGVGKTSLGLEMAELFGRPFFRIDGDPRFTEQKLVGWFDPPQVMKSGFTPEAFVPGPLLQAMEQGGVLLLNELNRLPEGVQNLLLPVLDEGVLMVPKLGQKKAHPQFWVIATQNPKEFTATTFLSEAILDRFELIVLNYQSEAEEIAILTQAVSDPTASVADATGLIALAVALVRLTRRHPSVRRGASLRAAISLVEITVSLMEESAGPKDLKPEAVKPQDPALLTPAAGILGALSLEAAFREAAVMVLANRIEMGEESSYLSGRAEFEAWVNAWVDEVLGLSRGSGLEQKKKSSSSSSSPLSRPSS